ncbi:MAG: autotransporter-associated beta strand repeat-containing protein [Thermoguttaceae bacterium]|nr:autotransporter-associated beta strand repeat-containing protein [Thermoguttaceae bacterium]
MLSLALPSQVFAAVIGYSWFAQDHPDTVVQYDFVGATDAERRDDKSGGTNYLVEKQVGTVGAPIAYGVPGFDVTSTAVTPTPDFTTKGNGRGFFTYAAIDMPNPVSFEAIFRPTGATASYMVAVRGSADTRNYFVSQTDNATSLRTAVGGGATNGPVIVDPFTSGNWYYVAVTMSYDTGANQTSISTWYADLTAGGTTLVPGGQSTVSGSYLNNTYLGIGLLNNLGSPFEPWAGSIDEVTLYTGLKDATFFQANLNRIHEPLYFDRGSGATTWIDDAATKNWGITSEGPYNATAWIGGANGCFKGTAGEVAVSGTIGSVNSILFDVAGYTLTGGTITLTGNAAIGGDNDAAISSALIGSSGLTKTGDGTLTLTGVSTYSGLTTISGGRLLVQGSGRIPGGNVSVASGATLEIAATNWAFGGNISGQGGLTKSGGSGDLRLTGTNTYTGPTVVSGSGRILRAGSIQAFGNNSALTVNSGAIVELNGYSHAFGSIAGSGTIRNRTGDYGSGSDSPAVLTVGGNNSSTEFSGVMEDGSAGIPLALRKVGTGTLTLRGINTYTGDTYIEQGRIVLGTGNDRLPTGTTVTLGSGTSSGVLSLGAPGHWRNQTLAGLLTSGTDTGNRVTGGGTSTEYSTLTLNIAGTNVFGGILGGGGTDENRLNLVKTGGGTLTLTAVSTYVGTTTVSAGRLLVQGSGRISNSSNVSIADDATLEIATTDWAFGGSISGGGGLTRSGTSGDLRLTGTNTYTGPTVVSGSGRILRAGSSQAFGNNSALTVNSGAIVELNGYSHAFGSIAGSGTIRNRTGSYGSGSSNPTVLTVGGNHTSTAFAGVIEDGSFGLPLGLKKVGTGTLTLEGSNNYTSTTLVDAGTLKVDGSLSGTSGVTLGAGATLAGSGTVAATVGGAGLVSPGSSPGILTIAQFDPSGGLDAALEFTAAGSPDYGNAFESDNDVLRITGAAPFMQSLDAGNTIDVYFDLADLVAGTTFRGGFYTDLDDDFLPSIENASLAYWVTGDGLGTDRTFNDQGYYSLENYASWFSVDVSTVAEAADFGAGLVYGRVAQFAVVPEPGTVLLLALGVLGLLARRRRHGTGR